MLAARAAAAGATFVDTYASSVGHDVCRLPGNKWVEGLVPTAPASSGRPQRPRHGQQRQQVLAALAEERLKKCSEIGSN